MGTDELLKKLKDCFDAVGIRLPAEGDVDIREYIEDSLQYMTAIVQIENDFDIVFDDEMLDFEKMASLYGLAEMIAELMEK